MNRPLVVRRGRPPAEQAGEVEERILQTAFDVFLARGYGHATTDQIGRQARVGNTTLYRRYPNKEALFDAVIHWSVVRAVDTVGFPVEAATASGRLRQMGIRMAEVALTPEVLGIMRMSAAEAVSSPAIADLGYRIGFGAAVERAARAIAGTDDQDDIKGARAAASIFVELGLHPLELQGMFGISLDVLRPRIEEFVDGAIATLLARQLLVD